MSLKKSICNGLFFLRRGSSDSTRFLRESVIPEWSSVERDKCLSWSFWRDLRWKGRKESSSSSPSFSSQLLPGNQKLTKKNDDNQEKDNYKNMEMYGCLADILLRTSHVNPSIWFSILKRFPRLKILKHPKNKASPKCSRYTFYFQYYSRKWLGLPEEPKLMQLYSKCFWQVR